MNSVTGQVFWQKEIQWAVGFGAGDQPATPRALKRSGRCFLSLVSSIHSVFIEYLPYIRYSARC